MTNGFADIMQDVEFDLQVNAELGEVGGVFVSQQPSDTDLGSKTPKQVSFLDFFSDLVWHVELD